VLNIPKKGLHEQRESGWIDVYICLVSAGKQKQPPTHKGISHNPQTLTIKPTQIKFKSIKNSLKLMSEDIFSNLSSNQ